MEPQSCEELWDALSAYSDGSAMAPERAAVEAHLEKCRRCARDLGILRAIASRAPDGVDVSPPPHLKNRILQATIHRPTAATRFGEYLSAARIPGRAQLALGGAIASAAIIVLLAGLQPRVDLTRLPAPDSGSGKPATAARGSAEKRRPFAGIAQTSHSMVARNSEMIVPTGRVPDASKSAARAPGIPTEINPVTTSLSGPMPTVSSPKPQLSPVRTSVTPEPEKAAPTANDPVTEPRIERTPVESPVENDRHTERTRVARAEERPIPPPAPEVTEMHATSTGAAYTLEAKSTPDPGAVASLADLRRSLQRETEDEAGTAGFRMNDRRELRLAVHTSRF